MSLQEWKVRNKFGRNYAHFDSRVSLDRVWKYVSNPRAVARHGFYPFIHYTLSFHKYNKAIGGKKDKKREICYSAHLDRYIYQYYALKLNQYYNRRVNIDGLDDVAIAYRDNLHKNNIHFAKRAIDFIKANPECHVIIGDFTGFFDNLDHDYLKDTICDLLNLETKASLSFSYLVSSLIDFKIPKNFDSFCRDFKSFNREYPSIS
ncbi:hypothetical protein [Alicyclobacillus sp. SP_1]|uniref:hypothetical protein n=1 Tax=Alicyclobacillus sp. SP_1 TaxID=2942475 RepID=UPI0021584EBC|nr:hypothetical protein [Alicyclobacillus sp. SP_1]